MTKAELVALVSEKAQLTKKDSEKAVAAVVESITEALCNGDKVSLVGFGTFEVKDRAARMGHNPRTSQPVEIPASKAPVFKAGATLKNAVNNK